MLVVHPHFHPRYTGVTRSVEAIVPELQRELETRVIGSKLGGLPRIGWAELLRAVRAGPVVWHAHRNLELLTGIGLRWLGKELRLVWTRHSVGRPSWFTRWIARFADRRISVSQETAATLGLDSVVVGHGVCLTRFRPPADRSAAWKALGIGGRYGVGVVGRVRPDKGQQDFADAVAPLLVTHPEWRAAVVGRVQETERAFAIDLEKRAPGLVLVPETRAIEPWYQGLTLKVSPSREEAFGLVRIEALASGACLVASQVNQVDRMLEHGRTGFVYPPGDVHALREILEMLMREPQRALEVGRNGAEMARAKLGLGVEAAGLLEVYRGALVSSRR
jgi:mannosyltransferase